MELAILAASLSLPIILAILFRYNISLGFLSLATGYLLQSYSSMELNQSLDKANLSLADNIVTLSVGLLPYLLTVIFTRKTFSKLSKLIGQFIPLVASCLMVAYLSIPYLTGTFEADFSKVEAWNQIDGYKGAVVAIGAFFSLAWFWLKAGKARKADKKHKK